MTDRIKPLKIGLQVSPPAFTLRYIVLPEGKERLRIMPVRFLNKFGPVSSVVADLKERHSEFLKEIPDIRVEKVIKILQEVLKGSSVEDASALISKEFSVDPTEDLNKLEDEKLNMKKQIMETTFVKHQSRPQDPDFVYDKRVDFNIGETKPSGWDSEEEEFWS